MLDTGIITTIDIRETLMPTFETIPRDRRRSRLRAVGLGVVFVWFFVGGIAHFALTAQEVKIVPAYIPWPLAAVLVSGVLELIGAAGLLHRATRRWAGWLLFAVTIAVTPVHIAMLLHADQWPAVPYWALVARLPLQLALLALIVWSTRDE